MSNSLANLLNKILDESAADFIKWIRSRNAKISIELI